MPRPVLICDDSAMARNQIASALPVGLRAAVSYARNGTECLEALEGGVYELLLLDLTMPELDGYAVLEALQAREDRPIVVVVSGDVQPGARQRVEELGAGGFLGKPINHEELSDVLRGLGLADSNEAAPRGSAEVREPLPREPTDFLDGCREVANVAMGRAAELLARLLDVFVVLPVPHVAMIERNELHMALQATEEYDRVTAVTQGFIGPGVRGEALLLFNEARFEGVAALLDADGELNEQLELELVMDLASVLIGACLEGISGQLNLPFSQNHPTVLGRHCDVCELLEQNAPGWGRMLAIEIHCTIENHGIDCDLLLLFTDDSMATLRRKVEALL